MDNLERIVPDLFRSIVTYASPGEVSTLTKARPEFAKYQAEYKKNQYKIKRDFEEEIGVDFPDDTNINWQKAREAFTAEDIEGLMDLGDPKYTDLAYIIASKEGIQLPSPNITLTEAVKQNRLGAVKILLDNGEKISYIDHIKPAIRNKQWNILEEFSKRPRNLSGVPDKFILEMLDALNMRYDIGFGLTSVVGGDMQEFEYRGNAYRIAKAADRLIDDYKNGYRNCYVTKEELTKLLNKSSDVYDAFVYLIRLGAPITFIQRDLLANFIIAHGYDILYVISSERLTNYMRDRIRAHNLIEAILVYYNSQLETANKFNVDKELMKVLKYLLENDKREPKRDSLAYKFLLESVEENESISNYLYDLKEEDGHKYFIKEKKKEDF